MKFFGTIAAADDLSYLDIVPPEGIYGMTVFVKRFVRYLLRYGDFDELHFFCRGPKPEVAADSLLASDPRVRLLPIKGFATETSRNSYEVFHNLWSPDVGPWTDLRNRLSARNFPITGLTHTISYQNFLPRVLGTMVLGTQPWDSIICTAECARTAMREWIAYIQEEFGGSFGAKIPFKARLDKIPLGVDPEVFQPGDHHELRARLNLPQEKIIALYFGRFSHYDKMDLFPLLLAFRKSLESRESKPLLVMAGSESFHKYSTRVQEFAEELGISSHVAIRTDVPEADVPAYYAAADFFISPSDSLQETFGQSIIEAMASGLPVICADWDGYKELVIHEQTGIRIPTYWMDCNQQVSDYAGLSDWIIDHFLIAQSVAVDVQAMADAITRLTADAELRRDWGANGRRRATEVFSWRSVIGQHIELWRELRAVADAAAMPERQERTWYRPDFFRTFRHYPTRILAETDTVAPGWKQSVQFYPELADFFDQRVFDAILQAAEAHPSVAELESIAEKLDLPPGVFHSHLLWLVKYGHLIVEGERRASRVVGFER